MFLSFAMSIRQLTTHRCVDWNLGREYWLLDQIYDYLRALDFLFKGPTSLLHSLYKFKGFFTSPVGYAHPIKLFILNSVVMSLTQVAKLSALISYLEVVYRNSILL